MSDGIVKKLLKQFHEAHKNMYEEGWSGHPFISNDLVFSFGKNIC